MQMKRVVFLAIVFSPAFGQARKPSKATDFSGNWVLNFEQTQNLPAGSQSCSMVVSQDERQLNALKKTIER